MPVEGVPVERRRFGGSSQNYLWLFLSRTRTGRVHPTRVQRNLQTAVICCSESSTHSQRACECFVKSIVPSIETNPLSEFHLYGVAGLSYMMFHFRFRALHGYLDILCPQPGPSSLGACWYAKPTIVCRIVYCKKHPREWGNNAS